MKSFYKLVIPLLLLWIIPGSLLKAQEFRFGVQVSPGLTWMNSNENTISGNGSNLVMKLGPVADLIYNERYILSTGINFAFRHGGTLKYDTGGDLLPKTSFKDPAYHDLPNGVEIKYQIQYLEIPLSFKMRTREFGYIRYFAQIPEISLLIATKSRADIEGAGIENLEDVDVSKDVKNINFSWGFGGGLEYGISDNTALFAGLHYQDSFIDMTRQGTTNEGEKEDSNSNFSGIFLKAGILF